MVKINVIFRACSKISHYSEFKRPDEIDKSTLIKICFSSLFESLKDYPYSIHVLGDDLSDELLSFFNQFPVTISNQHLGNDQSIRNSFTHALSFPDNEWVYFCEDDYLHRRETIFFIQECIDEITAMSKYTKPLRTLKAFKLDKNPFFIFPCDYPERYKHDKLETSLIFRTQHCHWRQVLNTTFTYLTPVKSIRMFLPILTKFSVRARDGRISKKLFVDKKCLCVCPIPSLTNHMHEGLESPFVNWKELLNDHKTRIIS